MEGLVQDIRYGVRMLLRNPGITAAVLLAMTLGIGANTTIFSGIDATLLSSVCISQSRAPGEDPMVALRCE